MRMYVRLRAKAQDEPRKTSSPVDEHGSGSIAAHADNVVVEDLQEEEAEVVSVRRILRTLSDRAFSTYLIVKSAWCRLRVKQKG